MRVPAKDAHTFAAYVLRRDLLLSACMSRLFGTLAIALGVAFVILHPHVWDAVVFTLPSDRDIHGYDLIGLGITAFGVILFWR